MLGYLVFTLADSTSDPMTIFVAMCVVMLGTAQGGRSGTAPPNTCCEVMVSWLLMAFLSKRMRIMSFIGPVDPSTEPAPTTAGAHSPAATSGGAGGPPTAVQLDQHVKSSRDQMQRLTGVTFAEGQ